jgi:Flp pilus assembly pilin Flp
MESAMIRRVLHCLRKGQSMVEYALILALIAIAVISAFTAFGRNASGLMENDQNSLGSAFTEVGS